MTDPRYDPRFQRGWDGELPPPAAPASAASPPSAAPFAPAASVAPAEDVPAPGPLREQVGAEPPAEEPAEPEPESAPARNPYRIALVVLGVVLTAAGGGMLWHLAQPTSFTNSSDAVLPQLEFTTAPWIALAGLLAIVAAIALGAFRRR